MFISAIAISIAAQHSECPRGFRCLSVKTSPADNHVSNVCRRKNGRPGICYRSQFLREKFWFQRSGRIVDRLKENQQWTINLSTQAERSTSLNSKHSNKTCVPMILCTNTINYSVYSRGRLKMCSLSDGSQGVLCPAINGDDHENQELSSTIRGSSVPFTYPFNPSNSFVFPIEPQEYSNDVLSVEEALKSVQSAVGGIKRSSHRFGAAASSPDPSPPQQSVPSTMQLLNNKVDNISELVESEIVANFQVLSQIAGQNNTNPSQIKLAGKRFTRRVDSTLRQPKLSISSSLKPVMEELEPDTDLSNCTPLPVPQCNSSIHRSIDGSCNNLLDPNLGASLKGFKRYLPNAYDDGIFKFRTKGFLGGKLPSARTISDRIFDTELREIRGLTISVMQWGQFIGHDLSQHILATSANRRPILCCSNNGKVFPEEPLHRQCIPIHIDAKDSFYSRFGQRCMSVVRSLPAPSPDCQSRPVVPFNALTSFLDASHVYGSQTGQLKSIRTFRDGLLRTSKGNLLPLQGFCRVKACFVAGDSRVNEQSALTVMHTIFNREHNRIALHLKQLKGELDDETLFQMSRRIVIAEWQHITYREWLPIVVGREKAEKHGLLPLKQGHSFNYRSSTNPVISAEFATAAFRFGHSLIRSSYDLIDANGETIRTENLTSTFFNPGLLVDFLNEHARTLVTQRGGTADKHFSWAIQEQLFSFNGRFGFDLAALNIQRGRDHGIARYTDILKICTGHQVNHWADLRNLTSSENIDQLRSVYAHPADVDLFVGGLLEKPAFGAIVGPTFQCIIIQQFMELRYGDRFFYDNGGMTHSFSHAQLTEIRKTSWARVMCDNLRTNNHQDFDHVQPLAFFEEDFLLNPVEHCDSIAIPRVDLTVF